ncbi:hypothetical protein P3S67_032289 [Capsicum chacoense]
MIIVGHFKSLVGNKSQEGGSIAEGYIVEEALTLYSRYLKEIESRLNQPKRDMHVGGFIKESLTHLEKKQAHRYVSLNCAAVKPFIDTRGGRVSATEKERRVSKEFPDWFPNRIMNPHIADTISYEMKFLAQVLARDARRFSAYNINGLKFRTLFREQRLKTQDSGVFLVFNTSCWADTIRNRGFKIDASKFNCVNFSILIHTGDHVDDDPYFEASQAIMVYYVDDENDKEWSVVVHLKSRDLSDMGEVDEEENYENEAYQQQEFKQLFDVDYENDQITIEEHITF